MKCPHGVPEREHCAHGEDEKENSPDPDAGLEVKPEGLVRLKRLQAVPRSSLLTPGQMKARLNTQGVLEEIQP